MWEEANQALQTEREGKEQTSGWREKVKGGIFQSDTSCLTPLLPSSVVSLPSPGTFPAHRRALPLWLRCQRKACLSSRLLCPFCLSSSISVLLSVSDFEYLSPVFSSAASSKCLQITPLWNSTLHLYLYVFSQYASLGLRFCWVADEEEVIIGKVVRATVMVVPGYAYSTGMFCNTEK